MLHLVYHLVKFGYFGEHNDIELLQKPLLNLLDGTCDLPFPEQPDAKTNKGTYGNNPKHTQDLYRGGLATFTHFPKNLIIENVSCDVKRSLVLSKTLSIKHIHIYVYGVAKVAS